MRKLKLQVQISVDGFVGGPNGELDWMTWNMDDKLGNYINTITDSSSTIFLGRKMADGFIRHWTSMLSRPGDPSYAFAKKMADTPKIVFTKTLESSDPMVMGWYNTILAKGNLADEVNAQKNQNGNDIIVYGGDSFVSSLIQHDLIDEYYLLANPATLGNGQQTFNPLKNELELKLMECKPFACGAVLLFYSRH